MNYSFVAEGRPRSKMRPRMTRSGRTYTPKETHEAEARIREQYLGPLFTGPIIVDIEYHKDHQRITLSEAEWSSKITADVDNLVKLTLDALQGDPEQPHIAFANDRQVVGIVAKKLH